MGNFSVNHYAKISLERDGVKITYIIDLAEIPTYQELQQANVTADVADPAVTRFVALRGAEFGRGLSLMVDGKRLPLRLLSSQVIFPPGAGGLPTMKMGFVYQAAYPPDITLPAASSMLTITTPVMPDGKRLSRLGQRPICSPAQCPRRTAAPS